MRVALYVEVLNPYAHFATLDIQSTTTIGHLKTLVRSHFGIHSLLCKDDVVLASCMDDSTIASLFKGNNNEEVECASDEFVLIVKRIVTISDKDGMKTRISDEFKDCIRKCIHDGEMDLQEIEEMIIFLNTIRDEVSKARNVTTLQRIEVLNQPISGFSNADYFFQNEDEGVESRSSTDLNICTKCNQQKKSKSTELCTICSKSEKKRVRNGKEAHIIEATKKKSKSNEDTGLMASIPFRVDIPLSEKARVVQILSGKASNLSRDQKLAFIKSYVDDQDPKFNIVLDLLDQVATRSENIPMLSHQLS